MSGKAIVRRPGRSLLFVVTDSRVLAVVVVGLTLPLAVSVASEPPRLFDSVVRALSGSPDDAPPLAIDVADGPRVARPGETVTGRFASGDPMRLQGVSRRGRFMHVWTLDGRAGHTATINMSSSSVDPYLLVTGPGLSSALTDDDGGNGRSARLTIEFPGTGAYRVIASTYAWGETGEYTLSVSGTAAPRETSTTAVVEAPPPPPASPAASTPVASATRGGIAPGASVSGSLASGDPSRLSGVSRTGPYMHAWTIQGVAGQSVTFDMRSTTLDSYLMVTGPGLTSPLSDDDGGSGRDARLTVRFPRTGEYQVVASAFGSGDTGEYSLSVSGSTGTSTNAVASTPRATSVPTVNSQGSVAPGSSVTGRFAFSDPTRVPGVSRTGRHVHVWTLQGVSGQSVTINMTSSNVDPYLALTGPGFSSAVTDDDGGDGTNARITVALPQSGTFSVIASTYSANQTGEYALSVSGRPATPTATAATATDFEREVGEAIERAGAARDSGDYTTAITLLRGLASRSQAVAPAARAEAAALLNTLRVSETIDELVEACEFERRLLGRVAPCDAR